MGGEPGEILCREMGSCREKDPAREEGGGRRRERVSRWVHFEQVRNDQVGFIFRGLQERYIRPHRQVVYTAK